MGTGDLSHSQLLYVEDLLEGGFEAHEVLLDGDGPGELSQSVRRRV